METHHQIKGRMRALERRALSKEVQRELWDRKVKCDTSSSTLLRHQYRLVHFLISTDLPNDLSKEGDALLGWTQRIRRRDPRLSGSHNHWRKRVVIWLAKVNVIHREQFLKHMVEV